MIFRAKQNRWRRLAWCCLTLLLTLCGIVLLLAGCMADRIIFQPPRARSAVPGTTMLKVADDIQIAVRYLPPPQGGYVLLYSHGNAEDLNSVQYRLKQYTEQGYGIAVYDYEGYGQSGGTPSETAACRDIERVWRYLVEECHRALKMHHRWALQNAPPCFVLIDHFYTNFSRVKKSNFSYFALNKICG